MAIQKYDLCYFAGNGGYILGDAQQSVTENLDGDSVKAVAREGYYFVEWSDGIKMAERTDKSVTADKTVTAKFEKNSYTLEYRTNGNGTIKGNAIQTVSFDESATTVTAIPNAGFRFVAWSDGVKTATRTDENIKSNITVTAEFIKEGIFTVNYVTDGNGTIEGEANQTVKFGQNGTAVTAVPSVGYQFVAWSDGVKTATRTDSNIKRSVMITARFEKIAFTVLYQTDGNGTIKGDASQTVKFDENTTTVTAIPDKGFRFVAWSDGRQTPSRTDRNVRQNITVTAQFEEITYTLNYQANQNGRIDGEANQIVKLGGNATAVTAIPNEGCEFVKWSDGVMSQTRTDLNVQQNIAVIAYFHKLTFRVIYSTNHVGLGRVNNQGHLEYVFEYGETAPTVTANPLKDSFGQDYVFFYWSDGVTTEERHDVITSSFMVTAYFGYKAEYKVNDNVGGRIEGECYQTTLNGGILNAVKAVPDEGYVFTGWSDLTFEQVRQDELNPEENFQKCLEYIAYFEPIEKQFRLDYGLASGTPLATHTTLNRNEIQKAEFTVPSRNGYKFCGWYADEDYRIRITNENGRYFYGYAAFSLETDTLFAKWQKDGETADPHKILLIFVDEVQTELHSSVTNQIIQVHSKMCALDYAMSRWVCETLYDLLNDCFNGNVSFEVDSYYTTSVLEEGFDLGFTSWGMKSYDLFANGIEEVFDIMYDYHNTIVTVGLNDYEGNLIAGNGGAGKKDACVYRENYWPRTTTMYQKYYEACKSGDRELNQTINETYLHEFIHTAEYFNDYDLHDAIAYWNHQGVASNITNTLKPYLLGEFEMNGEMCGIPIEYWQHRIEIPVSYVGRAVDGWTAGKIIVLGEAEDPDRPAWKTYVSRDVPYNSVISIQAVPKDGYRFVKWTDGVTTAIRYDKIIAHIRIEAIFEKIN